MANAEHIAILKSGIEQWNKWRNDNKEETPDLSNADLKFIGVKVTRPNFSNADLSGTNLSKVNLHQANLIGANLSNSFASLANFSFAYLSDADLSNANLSDSNFHGAYLPNANLSNANLANTNLTNANLTNANLALANLAGSNLSKALLSETNFNNCAIGQTLFNLTDLSTCKALSSVQVSSECAIDLHTLRISKILPKEFLTKLGIPVQLMENLPKFNKSTLMIYPAFISHSSNDKPFVRKLYDALAMNGVTAWLDEKNLKPGDNLHDSISEGIKDYDKLILVCSENSLNSWWVEKELEKVYEKEREMQKVRGKKFRLVIPIRIDDHILNWKEGILTIVRNSVIGDFTQWQDEVAFEKAVKELVDALNANRVDIRPPSFL